MRDRVLTHEIQNIILIGLKLREIEMAVGIDKHICIIAALIACELDEYKNER